MEDVFIAGRKFRAISVINLDQDKTIPEHRTEEQFSIADHVINEPAEFELELQLFKDEGEVDLLKQIIESNTPFELSLELGSYENMLVKSHRFRISDSQNIVYATLRIKQIRTAAARTAVVTLPDVVTQAEEDYQGGDAAVTPSSENKADGPEKQENKSWLDSIMDWFGATFGGG
jgi:hypothetical protein